METDIVYKGVDGQAITSSLLVAETFGKHHYHVMDVIKNLLSSHEKSCQFYQSANYEDGSGKSNPMYIMNRDGFTLLAMGFNGKKALEFKIKYIEAFNAMEQQLKQGVAQSLENLSRKQILQMALEAEEEKERLAARLALSEEKNREMEASIESILPRIEAIENRMAAPAEPVTPEFLVREDVTPQEGSVLTKYQRAHVYDKDKLKAIHPSYVTITEALDKIKKKGLHVNRTELFEYLRTNGYLSSNPFIYNCPEGHCMKKGWMLAAYGGAFNDRPKVKRMYVPYLNPKFVNLLEQMIREQLKRNKKNENNLLNQGQNEDK